MKSAIGGELGAGWGALSYSGIQGHRDASEQEKRYEDHCHVDSR
jgi:hypothetical protein